MSNFKFIHAADLHIDSPLQGLEQYEGAPVERIRSTTREAVVKLVDLAIEECVKFVVIAGDLFDGQFQDMSTGLWTAGQFRRLDREQIPVYLIRGNHDAASKVRTAVSWPDNVKELSVRKPESVKLDDLGVAIHGQGFSRQECPEDLAAQYPAAVAGYFNIGLLHTSLTGNSEHDTYAPTREDVLLQQGYDYWALGHIHMRSDPPINDRPYIAYSGNTQGRHIRETGPKGCLLVSVEDGELTDVDFRALDVIRWQLAEVKLEPGDALGDLLAKVNDQLVACHQAADGRLAAVRLVVSGACAAHQKLVNRVDREETLAEIRNRANDLDEEIWVEKIRLDTLPAVDLDKLRAGSDLIGDLLKDIQQIEQDDEELALLAKELSPLTDKAGIALRDAGVELDDPDNIRLWLRQAEGLLVSHLLEANE